MNMRIKIAIADPSVIIRCGIVAILKRLTTLHIDIIEITDISQLNTQLYQLKPDILIINPILSGTFSLQQIRNESKHKKIKIIALQTMLTDAGVMNNYDDFISLYDSADQIREKLTQFYSPKKEMADYTRQELSIREKEIITCVVKGMTNRLIADHLCLSTHTVITHRRNIANKLQIHSPAGLTIYAIINKLVELEDVKDTILSEE